ncbi:MAG: FAD binding domain-containing protein [Bosea sp. (in: a-proteobacteria)]
MPRYHRPQTLQDALALRAAAPGPALAIMAGGTDVFPVQTHRAVWFETLDRDVLDLTALPDLDGVSASGGSIRIGALTRWSTLAEAELPAAFDALKQACRQVGGAQIQNRASIGGNLCNASPAADGVPPLLALDAEVELANLTGSRRLKLSDFVLGNRRTALAPDEILVALHVPSPPASMRSTFLKLGARAYLVISIVSVAANLALDERGRIVDLRLAVGACSATPLRLHDLEARLLGQQASAAVAASVSAADLARLAPIDDVRASAAYRQDAALTLVRRALTRLLTAPLEDAA